MKLIDLLVRELPKRGGWPEGLVTAWQSEHDWEVYFCKPDNSTTLNTRSLYAGLLNEASDCRGIRGSVTRTQYEAALAAKNAQAWNGDGLPPVGSMVETVDTDGLLVYGYDESGEVIAHVENTAVVRMSYGLGCFKARFLRPLRTEADRKRDAAIKELSRGMTIPCAEAAYEAIAAGKIPGVKLEG